MDRPTKEARFHMLFASLRRSNRAYAASASNQLNKRFVRITIIKGGSTAGSLQRLPPAVLFPVHTDRRTYVIAEMPDANVHASSRNRLRRSG